MADKAPGCDWKTLESDVIEFMGGMFKWHRAWGKLDEDEQLQMIKAALPDETDAVRGRVAERLTSLHDGTRSEREFKSHGKTPSGHYRGQP